MVSILDYPANRVKLLKAGYTGSEIEWLSVHIFDNVEILGVNWQEEA